MISPRIRIRIKQEMNNEKPTVWIGKYGVTDQLLKEISRQLDRREVVKMRILKSALKNDSTDNIIQRIVQKTESTLIDKRGNIFVIYKTRKRKKPL